MGEAKRRKQQGTTARPGPVHYETLTLFVEKSVMAVLREELEIVQKANPGRRITQTDLAEALLVTAIASARDLHRQKEQQARLVAAPSGADVQRVLAAPEAYVGRR